MKLHKTTLIICWIALLSSALYAQNTIPRYFINTDLIYDAEIIPTIDVEYFFMKGQKLRSWHIDVGYQKNYSDQFFFNKGDVVSVGVYQGPVVKVGYSYFTKWHNRKWLNYFSPSLGLKYLWYDELRVNTDPELLNTAFRMQSEKCISVVPQLYLGQKRVWEHFCYDYYGGIQIPVKFRDKRIYEEADNYGNVNPNVPYTSNEVTPSLDIVIGIKVGYIRKVKTQAVDDDGDTNGAKTDGEKDEDEK